MKYFSGGYYVVAPLERADYMDKNLLPDKIVSASECICNFHPNIDVLWEGSNKDKQKYAEELGISMNIYVEMEKWIDTKFEEKTFAFPQLFTTVELAKEFCNKYLYQCKDIKILGIGLPEVFVDEFLDEEETLLKPDKERYGIEKLLINKVLIMEKGTEIRGYEVLGFEFGKFHSYICNGLEKDYHAKFNFSLNENGFIPTLEEAITYCEYSNDEEVGTEPVLWLPWAIYEYKL